jgi:N-carbamoyl-L-amino-acid hydrolase
MADINPDRLLSRLESLRAIGRSGTGVHRPALSPCDLEARLWVLGQLEAIGLAVEMDRFGTVLGKARTPDRTILIGSHTDTVPNGGWLDGALGVAYGLEIATAHIETNGPEKARIDVISFQDEEGTFVPCLGSRAFVGDIVDETSVADYRALDGRRLADALSRNGLAGRPLLRMEPGRNIAFLEAHIEQGPRLDEGSLSIGLVRTIVGIRHFRITITGRADHAGTTPMSRRQDAGAAMFRLASRILDRLADQAGADTVWNIGHAVLSPGAVNVVPELAEITLEVRDTSNARLDALEASIRSLTKGAEATLGMPLQISRVTAIPSTPMAADVVDALERASRALNVPALPMHSGAGHDAMILASHLPTAMLFVPSIGGRSHSAAEDTRKEDIVTGCRVMSAAAEYLLAANP